MEPIVFVLGINKASDVVEMLLQRRHEFHVAVTEGDPRRAVAVYTVEAEADVRALLEVI